MDGLDLQLSWLTEFLVFDGSAASNGSETQLFSGAAGSPGTADAASAYADAVNGYTFNAVFIPPFDDNIALTYRNATPQKTITFPLLGSGPETLIFAVPDNGLSDNQGGVSVLIAPYTSTPSITTTSLSNGQVGVVYPPTPLSASGGSGTYTWTATGLPTGLSVTAAGVLSGTPTVKGPFTAFFTVTDPISGLSFTQVTPFNRSIAGPTLALTINTTSIPQGEMGVAYSQQISATGGYGTYNWSISSGTPPLTINSSGVLQSQGPLSGGNDSQFTVTVTDTAGDSATSPLYTLLVDGAVNITTPSTLPNAPIGESWATTLTASGGTTIYTWSAGGLPAWLTLTPATGVISGVPPTGTSTSRPFNFQVTVTDSAGGTQTIIVTVAVTLPVGYLVENATSGNLALAAGDGSAVSLWSTLGGYQVTQDAGLNAVVATGGAIKRDTPSGGSVSTIAAAPPGSNWVAVAVDPFGYYIVGDNEQHGVWRVAPDGSSAFFLMSYSVTSSQPEDIWIQVDVHGNYIVAEDNNFVVGLFSINSAGTVTPIPLTGSTVPQSVGGLAFDRNGNYIVLDTRQEALFQITPQGATTLFTGVDALTGVVTGPAANPLTSQYVVGLNGALDLVSPNGQNVSSLLTNSQLVSPSGITTLTQDFPSTVDATNPLAYFRLETQSGFSELGGTYTYSLTGAGSTISSAQGPPIGNQANNYALLDGSTGAVTTNLSGSLVSAGSMMAWVNLAALPSSTDTISYIAGESAQGDDFDLQFETDNFIHFYTTCCNNSLVYRPNLQTLTGQWHMVVATYDAIAGTRAIYFDGSLVANDNCPQCSSYPNKTGQFEIGNTSLSESFGNRNFNGGIDEVAIWNYALTAAQVYQMYAARPAGSGGRVDSHSPTTVPANDSPPTLTINGAGFSEGTSVWWTSAGGQTSILPPGSPSTGTQLTVPIPGALLTTAGIAQVSVVSPGGVPSNRLPFTIAGTPLSFTPPPGPLPGGQTNQLYSQTFTAAGGSGNYSWSINNQSPGLNLSLSATTGTTVSLTGTPTVSNTDPGLSITVMLTDTSTNAQVPQSYTIAVSGGSATGVPVTWTLSNATFNDGGTVTGSFVYNAESGAVSNWNIVTTAGSTLPAFTYTPSNSTAYGGLTAVDCNCIQFTSNELFSNGLPPPENYSENRLLVLTFDAPLTDSGGTVNIFVDNSNDNASHECLDCDPFRLLTQGSVTGQAQAVPPPPPVVPALTITVSPSSIATTTGGSVAASFSASGGSAPYTYAVSGQPPGVTPGAGSLGGSPTQAGTFIVSVNVTDANKNSASTSITINVLGLTTSSLPNGTVGQLYAASIGAAGGTNGYTFSASGLPAGLSMSSSGYLSGTVKTAGTFPLSITVTSGGLGVTGSLGSHDFAA